MNKSKQGLVIVGVAIIGLVGGFFLNQYLSNNKAETMPHAQRKVDISTPVLRPEFALKDIEDQVRNIKEWDGKVLMINFWATWCPPCRREIPAFIELQDAYQEKGFSIIGVAIDTRQSVIDFTDPMGVNYPLLLGEEEGIQLTQAYGNRLGVLPYTVFVDRNGKIVNTHRNEITFKMAEEIIQPLL